jgi:hypothetical protein
VGQVGREHAAFLPDLFVLEGGVVDHVVVLESVDVEALQIGTRPCSPASSVCRNPSCLSPSSGCASPGASLREALVRGGAVLA